MIEGLAKAVLEPLAARWRNTALGTSLVLWLAALLLYLLSHPHATRCGTTSRTVACRIAESGEWGRALLLATGLVPVIGTAFLCAGVAPGLFTLLTTDSWRAGPAPLVRVGGWSVRLQARRRDRLSRRAARQPSSPGQARDVSAVYAKLRTLYPMDDEWLSASASGNVLAAVAERLDQHLGLDLTLVWNPLVALLSDGPYDRLVAQSTVVLGRCQQMLVALGGLALAPFFPWRVAIPWCAACLVAALAFRHGLKRETVAFAAQVHTVAVSHRQALYTAYGVPTPTGPHDEIRCGRTLSKVLRSFEQHTLLRGLRYTWPTPGQDTSAAQP